MAPTGPKKSSGPSRGPRNASSTTAGGKASTRSGVSKRRNGPPVKADRDGDLDMNVSSTANGHPAKRSRNHTVSSGSSSRPAGRPSKPTARAQKAIERAMNGNSRSPPVTLQVEGLQDSKAASNEGGGLKELLTFLERKAQSVGHITRPIRIKKSQIKGKFVYVTTTREDADEILKLNNFLFANATLLITEAPDGFNSSLSETALELKDQLRTILSTRYDDQAKLLNLSALGEDPNLNQLGAFSGEATPEKLFRGLMAVCNGLFESAQAKREAVVSISLAGNNVDDVSQVFVLADTFPDLINLDLSRNRFKDFKGLQKWRHRLRKIETLLLNDNPIETVLPDYKTELTTWFPKLMNLSGTQVRTPEEVAAAEAATKPRPIPQYGADFRDINRVGEGFITEFMQLYDMDRNGLAAKYYDEQSSFSIAVTTDGPRAPDVPNLPWTAYIKFSRNHTRITYIDPRQQRLFTGPSQVQAVWQQLPRTVHPNLATQFDKYIIDCHPIQGLADPTGQSPLGVDGMIMTIHGEFEDQHPDTMKTAKRSFSRTFLLGPGAPGGNPIRVVSDMLSVRPFNVLPTITSPPVTQTTITEEPQKEQMLSELCKQTGMTIEYSRFCLDHASWNFEHALATFNDKKATLPPEAFVAPV
ncbi:hypothetical protein F5Y18DRAFT_391155 [Xylariaceae sp. FL1019]|nr:hypothetical protein F5Y18DRAFT_391155 [Xylariaceae sp. FL1019]